jgi:hypothetical protein
VRSVLFPEKLPGRDHAFFRKLNEVLSRPREFRGSADPGYSCGIPKQASRPQAEAAGTGMRFRKPFQENRKAVSRFGSLSRWSGCTTDQPAYEAQKEGDMTNTESFQNMRFESAEPNALEAPAQMIDECGDAELSADEQEGVAGGHVQPNHNQNIAAASPDRTNETPSVPANAPIGEATELLPEEADHVAGAGQLWNHNQNIAAASPDRTNETPSVPADATIGEGAELLPEEADDVAGAGLPHIEPNHNQNLGPANPVCGQETPSAPPPAR